MPRHEHDPCIANLPGVLFACCGHGVGRGYVAFENGITIRFDTKDIERRLRDDEAASVGPDDEGFWKRIVNV
jgi:hypothetical protein